MQNANASYSPITVANTLLLLARKSGKGLSKLQLQKLVFLVQGWSLAALERPLVSGQPEAWDYGPAYRDLHEATRSYGSEPVDRLLLSSPFASSPDLVEASDDSALSLITEVWEAYGPRTAWELVGLTHQKDSPWSLAKRDNLQSIAHETMKTYYKGLLAEANED